jgi:hypothetical protein
MNDRSIMILVMTAGLAAAALAVAGIAASASAQAPATNATATENATSVKIIKHATNSYTISEGSARVGSFDTMYLISGSVDDINETRDLLTSTIQDDFNASSTIGYVMAQAAGGNSSAATLPNPFASGEEIRQTIAGAIQKGVEAAERSDQANGDMICNFGMDLQDFECRFVPLLDELRGN